MDAIKSIISLFSIWTGVAAINELFIDLSHGIDENIMVWPNNTFKFNRITIAKNFTEGGFWLESYNFCTVEHGGTHVDAPSHFARDGWTLDEIPINYLIGPGVVVDIQEKVAKDPLAGLTEDDLMTWMDDQGPLPDGAIVLVRSGWSSRYGNATAYFGTDSSDTTMFAFPGISVGAAQLLVGYERMSGRRVSGVGVETASLDYGSSQLFPTHVELAAANIYGIENLADLKALPPRGFQVMVLPIKMVGGSGGPARVIASLPPPSSTAAPPLHLHLHLHLQATCLALLASLALLTR